AWFCLIRQRVNGAILNHLRRLNDEIGAVVAMDWIGNIGYMYCLVNHNDIYVAKKIATLNITTSVIGMVHVVFATQLEIYI
ncbi:hypothetical protein, partial, partial [Absidia glauca]